jgi:hypothetical protein
MNHEALFSNIPLPYLPFSSPPTLPSLSPLIFILFRLLFSSSAIPFFFSLTPLFFPSFSEFHGQADHVKK